METATERKQRLALIRQRKADKAAQAKADAAAGESAGDTVDAAPEAASVKRKREGEDEETNGHRAKMPAPDATSEPQGDGEDDGVKFRNYRPTGPNLKHMTKEHTKPVSVDDQVQHIIDAAGVDPEDVDLDVVNLAPRKPNWDLKRDLDKKMSKLQKRTDKAIKQLIRERISKHDSTEQVAAA